jgi:hypothetical protein
MASRATKKLITGKSTDFPWLSLVEVPVLDKNGPYFTVLTAKMVDNSLELESRTDTF